MPDLYDYRERINDQQSYSRAGFTAEGGKASLPYLVRLEKFEEAIPELLGDCRVHPDDSGRLTRTLPKAHPQYPWMFCKAIPDIHGIGTGRRIESDEELEAPTVVPAYYEYDLYHLQCEFEPVPYAVLSDDAIGSGTVDWEDEFGDEQTTTYAEEWLRFCDWEYVPAPEVASAQHGQMRFRVPGLPTPDGPPPGGYTFSGFPRIILPRTQVRFHWYRIPFSYLDSENSRLDSYVGFVNLFDWYGWPAGSLLFEGVQTSKRYTPPFPERVPASVGSAFSTEKLCDVTLAFSFTKRLIMGSPPLPARPNDVVGGHNLQPFLGGTAGGSPVARGFYYASAEDDSPTFPARPFECLFADPDSEP